jgi:hypothetical protein
MELRAEYGHFQLWVHEVTGEVAFVDTNINQIMFTNPYDVSRQGLSDGITNPLFSQLIVDFTVARTGNRTTMYSHVGAARRNQISVHNLRNGIRVSYIIGELDMRRILPMWVESNVWHEEILSFFDRNDPADATALGMLDFYTHISTRIIGLWAVEDI